MRSCRLTQGRDLLPYAAARAVGLRQTVCSEYGVPGKPYDAQRLVAEGLKPGDFANQKNPAIPWEGNPVSLAGRIRMARSRDWKLIEERDGTCELYDLNNDPGELNNLYDAPGHEAIQADLMNRLQRYRPHCPGSTRADSHSPTTPQWAGSPASPGNHKASARKEAQRGGAAPRRDLQDDSGQNDQLSQ